jgi:hypothetical protein
MTEDIASPSTTGDATPATAPSAPSGGAPASGGSPATPAAPSSAAPSGPSPATSADAPADESTRDPRTGKFTKRPALPGVHTNREIRPIQTKADRQAARAAKEAATATSGSQPGAAGAVPPPGTPGAPAPTPEPGTPGGAAKFSFGGKEWESQAQAEQSFRTLQGIHRSLNDRLATVTQTNNQNQYSASEWKRVAEQAQAELEALKGGRPTGQNAGGAGAQGGNGASLGGQPLDRIPESADDILAGVDLGLVAEIAEERGPLAATHLLLTESLNRMLPAIRAEIERAQAPFAQYAQAAQVTSQAQGLIQDMGNWTKTLPDGTPTAEPLYPELSDPVALNKIAALWEKLGLSDDVALTPMGLMTAILHYRNMVGLYGGNGAAPTPTAVPGSTTTPQASGAAAAAAAVTARLTGQAPGGDALSGPSGVAVRPGHAESDGDRLRREFREAPGLHKDLGFVPKKGRAFTVA